MLWAVVILVALMIPLTAVILDSPVVRSLADRRSGGGDVPADLKSLVEKVAVLETEIEVMARQLGHLQESQQFLQGLIEDPAHRQAAPRQLPKPTD